MQKKLYGIAAAVMLAFATTAPAQTTTPSTPRADPADRTGAERPTARPSERKVKNAEEERIEAEYKADKARCDTMSGNAKDICAKEAKGKEKIAEAELDARANPSERNRRNVEQAKAEVKYEVAKERCEDMKAKDLKNACGKEAKAEHERAKAAMAKRSASAGASTTR